VLPATCPHCHPRYAVRAPAPCSPPPAGIFLAPNASSTRNGHLESRRALSQACGTSSPVPTSAHWPRHEISKADPSRFQPRSAIDEPPRTIICQPAFARTLEHSLIFPASELPVNATPARDPRVVAFANIVSTCTSTVSPTSCTEQHETGLPFYTLSCIPKVHGCNIFYLHAPNHRPRTHDLPHPGWPASARPSTRSTLAVRQVRRTTRATTRCECHSLSGHVAIPLALQQGWRASRCAFPFQGTVSEIDRQECSSDDYCAHAFDNVARVVIIMALKHHFRRF
jgi:hypothetical protein